MSNKVKSIKKAPTLKPATLAVHIARTAQSDITNGVSADPIFE